MPTTRITVTLLPGGPWLPATLTDERSESRYGQPVVVVDGETHARGPAEIVRLSGQHPERTLATPLTQEAYAAHMALLTAALAAGFPGSHAP